MKAKKFLHDMESFKARTGTTLLLLRLGLAAFLIWTAINTFQADLVMAVVWAVLGVLLLLNTLALLVRLATAVVLVWPVVTSGLAGRGPETVLAVLVAIALLLSPKK